MALRTDRFSLRLDPNENQMLQQLAELFGKTPSDALRQVLAEAYERRAKKKGASLSLSADAGAADKPARKAAKKVSKKKATKKVAKKKAAKKASKKRRGR